MSDSVMNYDEQVRMFKDIIPIGPKSISELVELLESQVDIKEIKPKDLSGHIMQTAVFNASHCILNDDLHLEPDKMSFLVFQVIHNEKSVQYYDDEFIAEKFVYVIFEKNTGYITSNSNQLFRELELTRGVSQYEYDTEGNQFRSLISHLAISYCEKYNVD